MKLNKLKNRKKIFKQILKELDNKDILKLLLIDNLMYQEFHLINEDQLHINPNILVNHLNKKIFLRITQ